MMTVFSNIHGIVYLHWFPEDQSIHHYSTHFLAELRERIRKNLLELKKGKSCVLHQDNAPADSALSVKRFLAKYSTLMLEYPSYSPDLVPCDFYLFPKVKSALKGTMFESAKVV
ncbi:putative mariner transposase [Trichonephila clavipes]|nr:putative mariner transposase [Trichonephila clavipes]